MFFNKKKATTQIRQFNMGRDIPDVAVQRIVADAQRIAQEAQRMGPISSSQSVKIVNGRVVQGTQEDVEQINRMFDNMGQMFQNAFASDGTSSGTESEPVQAQPPLEVTVRCKNCGAVNHIKRGQSGLCDYCGFQICE